jgi:ApbE superfamily uncharacterized protein (UPF0280 family)
MNARLRQSWLPDGQRLHLQDGPIDLIIQAFGAPRETARAYEAAAARMRSLLDELCAELAQLRGAAPQTLQGPVAQRMNAAVLPFCGGHFITPMAAVAGAVADEVLGAMQAAAALERAYVNNGGDIALHLSPGQSFTAGMVSRPEQPRLDAQLRIDAASPTRGIATSGWAGRSFSLGCADAVTVTAASAAAADAAATMIANETNLAGHPAIARAPANTLDPQSDLGDRLVTVAVGRLTGAEKIQALAAGSALAEKYLAAGLITGAALYVQDEVRVVAEQQRKHFFFETKKQKTFAIGTEGFRGLGAIPGHLARDSSRHCERSEAIHLFSAPEERWIASLRSQ